MAAHGSGLHRIFDLPLPYRSFRASCRLRGFAQLGVRRMRCGLMRLFVDGEHREISGDHPPMQSPADKPKTTDANKAKPPSAIVSKVATPVMVAANTPPTTSPRIRYLFMTFLPGNPLA